ncbi:MAG: transcription termination/antitermination protein NusG [Bdellovibrionales bacterium]
MEDFKWYILKTRTNCEARAKSVIETIIKTRKIEDQVKEVLIPERDVVEISKGKKVTRAKKIYPGYIFLQMKLSDDLWHAIKSAPNVSHFVGGTKSKPKEIPSEQLETIEQKIKDGVENPQTNITFSQGDTILVIDGPFKNFNGVVEEVNKEKARVKASVSIFGRPTPVEFDFEQVHKEG